MTHKLTAAEKACVRINSGRLRCCFWRGYHKARTGASEDECPYPVPKSARAGGGGWRASWMLGFREAEKELAKERELGHLSRGLYPKFSRVERADGGHLPGRKHFGCEYFVLDLSHDPFAIPALKAYAAACAKTFPKLAEDLLGKSRG